MKKTMREPLRNATSVIVPALLIALVSLPAARADAVAYEEACAFWPPTGLPLEHRDEACDRDLQNAIWAADDDAARATPPEDLIPDAVYLNMPEERTWVCPLDAAGEGAGGRGNIGLDRKISDNFAGGATGHPTRWVVFNEATSPILLAHVNALGLEVSAMDFATHPAHSDTAVYPHGPVVLPGQMAVVEGRQGQTFVAREYKEVLPMDAFMAEGDDHNGEHSWQSFKSVLPTTLSFLPQKSRFQASGGALHVLGHPGRVLMRHRMGNIYVRNQSGATCPETWGGESHEGGSAGAVGTPKDMFPLCNVLRKAFVNKVGCPIDIYFAPRSKVEGYNCERFEDHLGPLEPFLSLDPQTRDIDSRSSPVKFGNTYNGHSFVARMSHDQSLVGRIELDHDVVRDCPEPKRSDGTGAEILVDERLLEGVAQDVMSSNMTGSATAYDIWSDVAKVNATVSHPAIPVKPRRDASDLHWHNRTGIISLSVPIAS